MIRLLGVLAGVLGLVALALGILSLLDGDPTALLAALPGIAGLGVGFYCQARSR